MKKLNAVGGLVFLVAVVLILLGPRVLQYIERRQEITEREGVVLPPTEGTASSLPNAAASSSRMGADATSEIRTEVNLSVPFTSQAPHGVWDPDHKEACEEASVAMVLRYVAEQTFSSADDADSEVLRLVRKVESMGYPVDITAEEVVMLLESEHPSLNTSLLRDPSIDDPKKVLSAGSLVIVPAAGRMLGNPYFQTPGPLYHMLALRGFTKDGYVITNDPGTKRGEAFVYRWQRLLDSIHGWNGGDVENGAKVVIVVNR